MSASRELARVGPEQFEQIYGQSPDPWDYRGSAYEAEKYARTLAAIGPGRRARALEIGCSIGVFTEQLAPRCEALVALDFSARAIALARERLSAATNVELVHASFPELAPVGPWDLVVCSEVLYYLDAAALEVAIGCLADQLASGAEVVAVSWRGAGAIEPFRGEDLHAQLRRALAPWHVLDDRQPGYMLDRFDGRRV